MKARIGDIFSSKTATLVNTVNCVGVMGKGIAAEFKKRYPAMYEEYVNLCRLGEVKPGQPYLYTDLLGRSILNFPTKDHWKSPSKLTYVEEGLKWFCANYRRLGITSIAFPPLGCGNGGLDWAIVGPVMYKYLSPLPIYVEIYAPYGTKEEQLTEAYLSRTMQLSAQEMIGVSQMRIRKEWLLVPYVMQELNKQKYVQHIGRTIFQKICYVLTRQGVNTGLEFGRGRYGPYSKGVDGIKRVLANAGIVAEQKSENGKIYEQIVSDSFRLNLSDYSQHDIECASRVVDLFCRIKNATQAEVITTVIYAYDQTMCATQPPTEKVIRDYIIDWKPHWNGRDDVVEAIRNLSMLGWIAPDPKTDMLEYDEDLF